MCSAIFRIASRFFSWVSRADSSPKIDSALWWLAIASQTCSGRRQERAV